MTKNCSFSKRVQFEYRILEAIRCIILYNRDRQETGREGPGGWGGGGGGGVAERGQVQLGRKDARSMVWVREWIKAAFALGE